MKICSVINGNPTCLTWYDLLEMLTAIRKLEMYGLVDGNILANNLLDYYVKNYRGDA